MDELDYRYEVATQPLKRRKKDKKPKRALAALLVLAFGFGSGFAIGQGTNAAFNRISTQAEETAVESGQFTFEQVAEGESGSTITQTNYEQTFFNKALTVPEIAAVAADSVVEITTEVITSDRYRGQYVSSGAGSGVIFTEDGYIVTNNHVIDGASRITVRLRNGETYAATLIGTDSKTDLAVIKVEATGLSAATLGSSNDLQVGELAVAIGNPLGELGGTVTDGIISALDREIVLDGETMNLLQTNAAINPGNSGGGLFNEKGELIGVVVAKSSGTGIEGIGFAIPVDDVKIVISELLEFGYVQGRPMLNMSLLDITSTQTAWRYGLSQLGVYIAALPTGSNGELQGFQVGDCIIALEDVEVGSSTEVKTALDKYRAGDTISLTIERDGEHLVMPLILSEYKPSM